MHLWASDKPSVIWGEEDLARFFFWRKRRQTYLRIWREEIKVRLYMPYFEAFVQTGFESWSHATTLIKWMKDRWIIELTYTNALVISVWEEFALWQYFSWNNTWLFIKYWNFCLYFFIYKRLWNFRFWSIGFFYLALSILHLNCFVVENRTKSRIVDKILERTTFWNLCWLICLTPFAKNGCFRVKF